MSVPNIRTKRKVTKALRNYSRSMPNWVRWNGTTTKMRPFTANAFLLGVMLDRSVPAERAWDAAEWICSSIGDTTEVSSLWQAIVDMETPRLRGFLRYGYGGKAFHRHYKTFARLLPLAAEHILTHYAGDPRKIWNGQKDIDEVKRRLNEIPAIGPALANMAVLILARNHGLLGGKRAKKQLDVKPDVHVQRVFFRAGLVPPGASLEDVVSVARQLAPDFPASMDAPAWDIGKNWCRPRRPDCTECRIGGVCPRVGLKH